MSALELVKANYHGTNTKADKLTGIQNPGIAKDLDCNCIDCGAEADCSTPW